MELVCAIVLLMLSMSSAAPQDLEGKMFTFPQQMKSDGLILKLNQTELGALTVCMRIFSDLSIPHGLFLLTVNSSYIPSNNFFVANHAGNQYYEFQYKNKMTSFSLKNYYVMNKWQHVCATWARDRGLAQLWIDGKKSSRKFISKDPIKAPMSVILGQCYDPVGRQGKCNDETYLASFEGMLTDLHVYDYVLSPWDIKNYSPYTRFPSGNVLNWRSLDFEIHGEIFLEDFF